MLLNKRYCFICYDVFVSESSLSGNLLFPLFPVQPLIFTPKSLLFTPISRATLGSTRGTARGVQGGGGGPCVARRHMQPRTWCYPGLQFNLIVQSLIPDPSMDPVPAGDWGAELRRSSVSRTSQRRLRCFRLPTPVLSKGVLPFSLPWLDSIERELLGIPSLVFRPLKQQMAKKIMLVITVLTVFVFLDLFPPGQERFHWFVLVCIRISVTKFGVNDGINLTIP